MWFIVQLIFYIIHYCFLVLSSCFSIFPTLFCISLLPSVCIPHSFQLLPTHITSLCGLLCFESLSCYLIEFTCVLLYLVSVSLSSVLMTLSGFPPPTPVSPTASFSCFLQIFCLNFGLFCHIHTVLFYFKWKSQIKDDFPFYNIQPFCAFVLVC